MRQSEDQHQYDIVVLGGTPGGIASAVSAARAGCRVALVESGGHLGGMAASGLGKSDIETREAIGGLFREFVQGVHRHYARIHGPESEQVLACRDGYYYEPSVAERTFGEMIAAESRIDVFRKHRLQEARREDDRLIAIHAVCRETDRVATFQANVFIDATYEGDLVAASGAAFRVGRESRDAFDEPHAGVIYLDYDTGEILPGSTGEGDDRLPAYTYRLCLTTDPENGVPLDTPPPEYERSIYLAYLDDLRRGRLSGPKELKEGWGYYPAHFDTLVRALSVAELPNQKVDVNINPRPLAFPFAEANRGYLEGDYQQRETICRYHRNLTLGLLYFLQNDVEVPLSHRRLARQYCLPKDEFIDNGHFPWQLYVREGRRLCGEYTLTEHDVTWASNGRRPPVHDDAIAVGEFPIDSFPCRRREPGRRQVLEGYLSMLYKITRPYQIPYRIMIPERVDGLIVPVAASTTHVAFSTIRMEPCWMAMGQAAGTAASLAVAEGIAPREVPIAPLQRQLMEAGQVLSFADLGQRHVTIDLPSLDSGRKPPRPSYLEPSARPAREGTRKR